MKMEREDRALLTLFAYLRVIGGAACSLAVLLCGTNQELLLVGTNDSRIEVDPDRLTAALQRAPAVQADLQRVGLGTITDIVGMFVGAPRTLHDATSGRTPVTDDRPIQEYGAKSRLSLGYQKLPASISCSLPLR